MNREANLKVESKNIVRIIEAQKMKWFGQKISFRKKKWRPQGRPKIRRKDCITENLKAMGDRTRVP